MKARIRSSKTDEAFRGGPLWMLGGFVAIVALTGGGSRYDIASIPFLRAFAIFVAFLLIALTPSPTWRSIRVPLGLLAALVVWMGIQLVPLPPDVWSSLPLRGQVFAIDQLLGASDRWRPISMTPSLTISSLLSLCVPFAALLVATALPVANRNYLWWATWAFGVASVILGLLQIMGGPRSFFYLYRITNEMSPVGLFANRNHHALLLSLSILSAGWLISREIVQRNQRPLLVATLMCSIAVFLLFTLIIGSRMGLLCGIASTVLAYLGIRWSYGFRPKPINQARGRRSDFPSSLVSAGRARRLALNILPFVLISGLAAVFYYSGNENSVGRLFHGDGVEEVRVATLGTVAGLLEQQWLLGTGFGSFAAVYQVIEPDALLREAYFNHAHNDWFELVIEGGLPAVIIFFCGATWIFFQLGTAWRGRLLSFRAETIETVMLAASFGVFLGGSAFDYPLRTPSMMMVAAFLIVILIRHRNEILNSPSRG